MKITDYVDVISCNIKITYNHNPGCRWSASFEYAEVIEHAGSCMLASLYGNAETPDKALDDYVRKIRGKILVFNAWDADKRREYKVPEHLGVI